MTFHADPCPAIDRSSSEIVIYDIAAASSMKTNLEAGVQYYSHPRPVAEHRQIWRDSSITYECTSRFRSGSSLMSGPRGNQCVQRGTRRERSQSGVGDRDLLVAAGLVQMR